MYRAIAALWLIAAAHADTSFSPPLIGYVYDGGVRPIVGAPGAARVLAPIALDVPIAKVALAPARQFGIASLKDGASLALVKFGAEPATTTLPETVSEFDSIVFNRTGDSAAIFAKACGCIQVVTGLPDNPTNLLRLDASGVKAMALSSDASVVAYSLETETVTSGGKTWPVSATALAFSPDDSSIAIVDGVRKSVSIASADLAVVANDLTDPTSVSYADAGTILVSDGRVIRAVNTATGETTSTECFCRSSIVEPTAMKHVFRISDLVHGSVWLLERGDQSSRSVFVPVESPE